MAPLKENDVAMAIAAHDARLASDGDRRADRASGLGG
jgi:hypothetical protein